MPELDQNQQGTEIRIAADGKYVILAMRVEFFKCWVHVAMKPKEALTLALALMEHGLEAELAVDPALETR